MISPTSGVATSRAISSCDFLSSAAATARAASRTSRSASSSCAIPSRSWIVPRSGVPLRRQTIASRRTAEFGSRMASSLSSGRYGLTSPGWSEESVVSAISADPRAAALSSSSPRRSSSSFWRKRNCPTARNAWPRIR